MSVHINATLYGKMYLLKVLAKLREKTRVAEIPVLQLDCHSGKVTYTPFQWPVGDLLVVCWLTVSIKFFQAVVL